MSAFPSELLGYEVELDPDRPVFVIGAAGIDIIGRVDEPFREKSSNPARIRTTFGGVARNVAENLARLGQSVVLLTAVGEDQSGVDLLRAASATGIDVSHALRIPGKPTSTYLAVVDPGGETHFALDDMRIMIEVTSEYIRLNGDLFRQASLLFVDANVPRYALRSIFALARRAKLPVIGDPATASLAHRLKPYLPELLMITPNETEAVLLCDQEFDPASRRQSISIAKKLVAQGVKIAIITLGERGVCYATSETSGYVPSIHTEVLDPTGAGDALTASVIFGLLNQIPLDEAIRLGVSAASLTLSYRGAVVPDLTLEKLYDHLVI